MPSRESAYKIPLKEPIGASPQYFWVSDKREIVVFRDRRSIRAFSSICPHMGSRLCFAEKTGDLFCQWHGLSYNVRSGASNQHRYQPPREYQAEIHDGVLHLYG